MLCLLPDMNDDWTNCVVLEETPRVSPNAAAPPLVAPLAPEIDETDAERLLKPIA